MVPENDLERCPWCHEPMAKGAAVCMACGFNRRSGRHETVAEEKAEPPEKPPPTWRERYRGGGLEVFLDREVPIGMIAVSLLVVVVVELIGGSIFRLPFVLFGLLVIVVFDVAWMYAGMSVLETLVGGTFGRWDEVVLKLAAINLLWFAMWLPLEWAAPILSTLIAIVVTPVVMFFLLRWLFELDLLWAVVTLVMIWLIRWIAEQVLSTALS